MLVVETGSPRGEAARPVEPNQGHRERALAPFPEQVCRDPSAGIRGAPQIELFPRSPGTRRLSRERQERELLRSLGGQCPLNAVALQGG